MRLIDADALKFDIMCVYGSNPKYLNWLNHAPTVDAVPVRHGKWTFNPKDAIEMMFTLPKCSECGAESANGGNYCPNCGARMDKDETD